MSPADRARLDDLDRFWDALSSGGWAAPDALDPELTETVRWLHAGDFTVSAPPGTAERIWQRALAASAAVRPSHQDQPPVGANGHSAVIPRPRSIAAVAPTARRWALTHLATAALLALTLVSIAVAFGEVWMHSADERSAPGDVALARGNAAHTGEMPGPGPTSLPVVRWQAQLDGPVVGQPAVDAHTVYVAAGNTLSAVDRTTAAVRWRFATTDQLISGPAVTGDLVEVVENGGTLHAVDRDTGQERWQTAIGPMRFCSSIPVAPDNGLVYVSGTGLTAIDAATGKVRWRAPAPIGTGRVGRVSSPAVADGRVFVGSADGSLYALDADSGEVRWRFAAGSPVSTSPAVVAGVVYFGNDDGTLFAVRTDTGSLVWSAKVGRWLDESSPAVVGGRVFIVSESRVLVALDGATGEENWRFAVPSGSETWPVVATGVVYLGSKDGTVHALDAATGSERWHFQLPGQVESEQPAVTGGVVYVGDDWNVLYALGSAAGDP